MLPLVTLPTPSLHAPSRHVSKTELLSTDMRQFCHDLIPAMYHYEGIGLAAPQVDKNIQICVIGKEAHKKLTEDLILINPSFERISRKTNVDTEGCLSVPNKFGKVKRFTHIHVTAWDIHGNKLSFEAKHFFARVIQHEIDHLQGTLIADKAFDMYEVSPEDRKEYIAELRRERRKQTDEHDDES